ncbi:MAG TPA: hypothetical protein VH352_13315, partial [Pseudonocardiaceae bacterium]|nr:hypothetical protein [Pseudonocardiaceae bacterium]
MGINRRKFLGVAGAGVVAAALDVGGLVSPVLSAPAFADTGGVSVRGLFGGTTTLDQTVVKGPLGNLGYVSIVSGPGEVHSSDQTFAQWRQPTVALTTFVQMSDLQIVDDKSPGRVEFSDRLADRPTDGSHSPF